MKERQNSLSQLSRSGSTDRPLAVRTFRYDQEFSQCFQRKNNFYQGYREKTAERIMGLVEEEYQKK